MHGGELLTGAVGRFMRHCSINCLHLFGLETADLPLLCCVPSTMHRRLQPTNVVCIIAKKILGVNSYWPSARLFLCARLHCWWEAPDRSGLKPTLIQVTYYSTSYRDSASLVLSTFTAARRVVGSALHFATIESVLITLHTQSGDVAALLVGHRTCDLQVEYGTTLLTHTVRSSCAASDQRHRPITCWDQGYSLKKFKITRTLYWSHP